VDALRCPFCHDGLGAGEASCAACGAAHHPACWAEAGRRCATCSGGGWGSEAVAERATDLGLRHERQPDGALTIDVPPRGPKALDALAVLIAILCLAVSGAGLSRATSIDLPSGLAAGAFVLVGLLHVAWAVTARRETLRVTIGPEELRVETSSGERSAVPLAEVRDATITTRLTLDPRHVTRSGRASAPFFPFVTVRHGRRKALHLAGLQSDGRQRQLAAVMNDELARRREG